jgi:SapC
MTTQLLIYNEVQPVSFGRHGDLSVKPTGEFGFARQLNSVPLLASEISSAAAEYPVVFAGSGDAIVPVAVLGLRERDNLFLDEAGKWQGRYVPAFLRRYPFVFSTANEGQTLTLCVDESYPGCNRDNRGERLFDADGEQTVYLKSVLEFLKQYQAQFERTRSFCGRVRELDLLEPMTAEFTLPEGGRQTLGGFLAVKRDKLRALSAESLEKLARTDELELLFVQLQSMQHFARIVERAAAPATQHPASAAESSRPIDS